MWWCIVALLAVIGYGLWRASRYAKRIEEDSVYLGEISRRGPYGEKFLHILAGRSRT